MIDDACLQIKERIEINVGGFEEKIPLKDRIHPNADPVINEPKDVKKLLARYAADKMPDVNDEANE